MAIWAWILIAVAVIVVVALLVARVMQQRRTAMLRERFGPEYDRVLQERADRRAAEADLRDRKQQRDRLDIRPLADAARARFAAEWRELQQRFVDQPADAVVAADALVDRVMSELGYPMDNFAGQAKLISVDHPTVVENYRLAHAVCERAQSQPVSTEDLRTALLHYRSLFDDLLHSGEADMHSQADSGARDVSDREEPSHHSNQRGTR